MSDTDPFDLDAIEARANAATEGPWMRTYQHVIEGFEGNQLTAVIDDDPDETPGVVRAADSAFIAHARQDIPALIAEVRRLREEFENHECRQTVARHGTRSKYTRGCRCDLCKKSEAEYSRRRREQDAAVTIAADDPRHGTLSCYSHYGCRCKACSAAASEYTRARRAAKKGSVA